MHLPPHISGNPNCCCFFSRPANSILRQLTEVPQPDQVYFLVSKILKYSGAIVTGGTNYETGYLDTVESYPPTCSIPNLPTGIPFRFVSPLLFSFA